MRNKPQRLNQTHTDTSTANQSVPLTHREQRDPRATQGHNSTCVCHWRVCARVRGRGQTCDSSSH